MITDELVQVSFVSAEIVPSKNNLSVVVDFRPKVQAFVKQKGFLVFVCVQATTCGEIFCAFVFK